MKVKDRMTPNPHITSPDTSVGDLWRFMVENNLSRIPVVDRGKMVAIVTRRDFGARTDLILRRSSFATRLFSSEQEQNLDRIRVRDIIPADQQLITIHQEAYIEQASRILRDNKISGLPVIDDDGRLVGIITQTDISDAFLDLMGVNQRGTRLCLRMDNNPEQLGKLAAVLSAYELKIENLVSMEVKNEKPLLILRLNTVDSRAIVQDIKASGFQVESVIVKQ